MTRDEIVEIASGLGITALIMEVKLQEFLDKNPQADVEAPRSRIQNIRKAQAVIYALLEDASILDKECNRLIHYTNADSN